MKGALLNEPLSVWARFRRRSRPSSGNDWQKSVRRFKKLLLLQVMDTRCYRMRGTAATQANGCPILPPPPVAKKRASVTNTETYSRLFLAPGGKFPLVPLRSNFLFCKFRFSFSF